MRTIKCARCGKIMQASKEVTLCDECRAGDRARKD